MKKNAAIEFKFRNGDEWIVTVSNVDTGEIIRQSVEKLGAPGKLTVGEKIDCMRMSIGAEINSKGYYF